MNPDPSAESVRVPNRCGACGAEWYQTHSCPHIFNSTSGGMLGPRTFVEPALIIVRQDEWERLKRRVAELEAAVAELNDGCESAGTMGE